MKPRRELLGAVLTVFVGCALARAENRFFVPDGVPLTVGQPGQIQLMCDNDVTVLGFSFGVSLETTKLELTGVTNVGTVAQDADFYEGQSNAGTAGFGCVFDTDGDFSVQRLSAGTNQVMAILTVNVVAAAPGTTTVVFEEVSISRPVKNVMTNTDGFSIKPGGGGPLELTLVNGTITIDPAPPDPVPVINGCDPTAGLAGQQFTILGAEFDQDGLAVSVCGVPATFDPPTADGTRLLVTAPACDTVGPADVEVTTVFGTATSMGCFTYEPGMDNTFIRGDADESGAHDLTDGVRILNFLFLGGAASRCRDAMDSNDTGSLDLTDGVYMFNWLFLGGPQPLPPFPGPGVDPTPDNLPECGEGAP